MAFLVVLGVVKEQRPHWIAFVDIHNKRLINLFADLAPDPRVLNALSNFSSKRKVCPVNQPKPALLGKILDVFERPVFAQSDCGTDCAGQYMTSRSYPCTAQQPCNIGFYTLVYPDVFEGDPDEGYQETGGYACGSGCQCRVTLCFHIGNPE